MMTISSHQAWERPGVLDLYHANDWLRVEHRAIARLRKIGTVAGPTDKAWDLLDGAANRERRAWMIEAALDGINQ